MDIQTHFRSADELMREHRLLYDSSSAEDLAAKIQEAREKVGKMKEAVSRKTRGTETTEQKAVDTHVKASKEFDQKQAALLKIIEDSEKIMEELQSSIDENAEKIKNVNQDLVNNKAAQRQLIEKNNNTAADSLFEKISKLEQRKDALVQEKEKTEKAMKSAEDAIKTALEGLEQVVTHAEGEIAQTEELLQKVLREKTDAVASALEKYNGVKKDNSTIQQLTESARLAKECIATIDSAQATLSDLLLRGSEMRQNEYRSQREDWIVKRAEMEGEYAKLVKERAAILSKDKTPKGQADAQAAKTLAEQWAIRSMSLATKSIEEVKDAGRKDALRTLAETQLAAAHQAYESATNAALESGTPEAVNAAITAEVAFLSKYPKPDRSMVLRGQVNDYALGLITSIDAINFDAIVTEAGTDVTNINTAIGELQKNKDAKAAKLGSAITFFAKYKNGIEQSEASLQSLTDQKMTLESGYNAALWKLYIAKANAYKTKPKLEAADLSAIAELLSGEHLGGYEQGQTTKEVCEALLMKVQEQVVASWRNNSEKITKAIVASKGDAMPTLEQYKIAMGLTATAEAELVDYKKNVVDKISQRIQGQTGLSENLGTYIENCQYAAQTLIERRTEALTAQAKKVMSDPVDVDNITARKNLVDTLRKELIFLGEIRTNQASVRIKNLCTTQEPKINYLISDLIHTILGFKYNSSYDPAIQKAATAALRDLNAETRALDPVSLAASEESVADAEKAQQEHVNTAPQRLRAEQLRQAREEVARREKLEVVQKRFEELKKRDTAKIDADDRAKNQKYTNERQNTVAELKRMTGEVLGIYQKTIDGDESRDTASTLWNSLKTETVRWQTDEEILADAKTAWEEEKKVYTEASDAMNVDSPDELATALEAARKVLATDYPDAESSYQALGLVRTLEGRNRKVKGLPEFSAQIRSARQSLENKIKSTEKVLEKYNELKAASAASPPGA